MRIDGARVWITGASSGIGRALARELARRGARVAISARRVERLDQLAAEGAMLPVPVDVTDLASMMQAAARVESELGAIDLAIFNAGIWEQVNVAAWDSELFRRHFDTNLMGLVHGVEAVLPGMRRRRAGTIAGMASVAGYRGIPRSEAYGATKAAEINMLESMRIDLGRTGIRVVTVCPGFVRSELTDANSFPMPFLIEAEEAARRIADGLEKGKPEIVFPLPMMLLMKAARLVPVRAWTAATAAMTRRGMRR